MSFASGLGLRCRFPHTEERDMSAHLPYEANRVRLDDVLRQAEVHRAARAAPATPPSPAVAIRRATASDGAALERLAALDSARPLAGDVLIAEVRDEPHAAIEVETGRAVADPFRPTADLVAQLRDRTERQADVRVPRRRLRLVPHFAH